MSPTVALVGSIVTLLVSILTAVGTLAKVFIDRKAGIGERELDQSRFSLDSLQAALSVKDVLITQYREEIERLRKQIDDLETDIERLEK